jgi:Na+/proline symporter
VAVRVAGAGILLLFAGILLLLLTWPVLFAVDGYVDPGIRTGFWAGVWITFLGTALTVAGLLLPSKRPFSPGKAADSLLPPNQGDR